MFLTFYIQVMIGRRVWVEVHKLVFLKESVSVLLAVREPVLTRIGSVLKSVFGVKTGTYVIGFGS